MGEHHLKWEFKDIVEHPGAGLGRIFLQGNHRGIAVIARRISLKMNGPVADRCATRRQHRVYGKVAEADRSDTPAIQQRVEELALFRKPDFLGPLLDLHAFGKVAMDRLAVAQVHLDTLHVAQNFGTIGGERFFERFRRLDQFVSHRAKLLLANDIAANAHDAGKRGSLFEQWSHDERDVGVVHEHLIPRDACLIDIIETLDEGVGECCRQGRCYLAPDNMGIERKIADRGNGAESRISLPLQHVDRLDVGRFKRESCEAQGRHQAIALQPDNAVFDRNVEGNVGRDTAIGEDLPALR